MQKHGRCLINEISYSAVINSNAYLAILQNTEYTCHWHFIEKKFDAPLLNVLTRNVATHKIRFKIFSKDIKLTTEIYCFKFNPCAKPINSTFWVNNYELEDEVYDPVVQSTPTELYMVTAHFSALSRELLGLGVYLFAKNVIFISFLCCI